MSAPHHGPRRVPVRLSEDEHEFISQAADRVGQSLAQFIARAAIARAAYQRGRAGEDDPYKPPKS